MKKILKWAGIVLAGFVILLFGMTIGSDPLPEHLTPEPEITVQENEIAEVKNFETAKVARVIDGDTIELVSGAKVRYIGIDTPETVDPRKPAQCYGAEASAKNKELVEEQAIRLEKDVTDKDKYGRLLRYVYVGDTFVNQALVEGGYAFLYTYPPDVKYQSEFLAAEQAAQAKDVGLWGACTTLLNSAGARSRATTAPAAPVSTDSEPVPGACAIKGNISSSGEKIYHVPGCGSYSKTVIDASHGEQMFCTEAEAQALGWRKALNCP